MNSFIFKFFLFEDFCLEDFTRSRKDKTIWSERPRYTNQVIVFHFATMGSAYKPKKQATLPCVPAIDVEEN